MTLRHRLGALVYDGPRFLAAMSRPRGWVAFRNRNERLTIDAATGGARCEWKFTSDLHIAGVYPSAGRRLMRRALRDWPIAFAHEPRVTGAPRATFVIGHRGEARLPHLLATIGSIAAQDTAIECIVVEQSAAPMAKAHLPQWAHYIHTPVEQGDIPYNRSSAFNAGARIAAAKLVILHDNDFLVPVSYATELLARHAEGWDFIDTKRFMFYVSAADTERLFTSGTLPDGLTPEKVMQNSVAGGSIGADHAAYEEIGGFDEGFTGWGGEDNEFLERARTRRVWAYGYLPFLHLWHESQPGRTAGDAAPGIQRMLELEHVPPEDRIARLRSAADDRLTWPHR